MSYTPPSGDVVILDFNEPAYTPPSGNVITMDLAMLTQEERLNLARPFLLMFFD